jgi:hypothetical protein
MRHVLENLEDDTLSLGSAAQAAALTPAYVARLMKNETGRTFVQWVTDQRIKMSRPWDWAKGFDESAPVTSMRRAAEIGHPGKGRIGLSVNGETRQTGDLGDMIWPVADIISQVLHAVVIKPGDKVAGGVDGIADFHFEISKLQGGLSPLPADAHCSRIISPKRR